MIANFVLELANAPGSATTINLAGAPAGRRTFGSSFTSGALCYYALDDGTQQEEGVGTYTSGSPNTLARTTVLWNSSVGRSSPGRLTFSGTTRVYNALPAERTPYFDAGNGLSLLGAFAVAGYSTFNAGISVNGILTGLTSMQINGTTNLSGNVTTGNTLTVGTTLTVNGAAVLANKSAATNQAMRRDEFSSGPGWRVFPDGSCEQWGLSGATNASGQVFVTYPLARSAAAQSVVGNALNGNATVTPIALDNGGGVVLQCVNSSGVPVSGAALTWSANFGA